MCFTGSCFGTGSLGSASGIQLVKRAGTSGREERELHPVWSIPIGDIKELKKIGGLGWKAKLVVGELTKDTTRSRDLASDTVLVPGWHGKQYGF